MIQLDRISRSFQVGDQQVLALREVSLSIAAGEYIAIMGPSGSGKSTLLNLLGLLDRADSGRYTLDGRDVTGLSEAESARVRREKIGFVFQFFHLVPRQTAAANVALPLLLAGITAAEVVSCSVLPSRAPCRCIRRCCWPTSRPAISTVPPDAK